jgi:hypothetical protein
MLMSRDGAVFAGMLGSPGIVFAWRWLYAAVSGSSRFFGQGDVRLVVVETSRNPRRPDPAQEVSPVV